MVSNETLHPTERVSLTKVLFQELNLENSQETFLKKVSNKLVFPGERRW